jgi:hypothetical protein
VEAQIAEKADKTNCRAEFEKDRRALDAGWHGGRGRLEIATRRSIGQQV